MSRGVSHPADVKDRIIEEAMRLFGTNGFDGTSLQAIADAVGITKQSVLYHFASKEVLREQVTETLLAHWKSELPRLLTAEISGYDRFSSSVTAVVRFFLVDPNRARVTVREMLDRPETMHSLMKEQLSPWTTLLTDYIRAGQESGRIRPDVHPESYIIQVMMMVIGTVAIGDVVAALVHPGGGDSLEEKVSELVRISREALYTTPETSGQRPEEMPSPGTTTATKT